MPLQFRSHLGDQPWFFVPDTGSPGGAATITGPSGVADCVETQTTTGEHSSFGPRVGFKVPYAFTEVGTYLMTIVQDDVTTVYEVDVAEPGSAPLPLIHAPNLDLTTGE